jgi:hypothetical protein
LLEQPRANLAGILPLLSDKSFRMKVLGNVRNEQIKSF